MLKRLIVLALSLMIMLTTLVVAIPAYADFKDGDIVTISESAGGGVYYKYYADQKYNVSAMNVTMEGSNATYFAWCASYGVPVPQAGRRYILCNTDNAGTVTVNGAEWPLYYAVPSEGIYWYYDTGLKDYIDFSWALSCIKAAEHQASTTNLSFAWRMAVELAIRSQLQGMFGNYGLDLNVEVIPNSCLFGTSIAPYFTEPDCDTVAEFMERAKTIADYANTHPVFWEPYAEEIEAVEERRNFYRGDDFILFEGHLNKSNCEYTVRNTYPGVEVKLNGGMLTVSIPKSKMPLNTRIRWNVDLSLSGSDNYNMFYGKPENGGTDVQNIVVYSVNKKDLEKTFKGDYITTEEKATVTVQKTDENGKALSGMKFELYRINDNGTLGTSIIQTTNSNGIASWIDRDLGDYFLVENCEGTGYEPHKPEQWKIDGATSAVYTTIGGKSGWKISLAPGDVGATVSAVNKQTETSLLVEKFTTDDSDPQGFKFTLYPVNADGTLGAKKQGTTNASGLLFFSPLELGTYFLVENCEGTGYAPHNPEQWQIGGVLSKEYTTINGMQGWKLQLGKAKAWVYAENYEIPTLSLNKTDRDGKPIKGMEFSIYTLSGDIPLYIDSFKTDENGYIDFEIKETGSYFIIEERNGKWEAFKPNEWQVRGASEAEYTAIRSMKGWLLYLDEGDNASIEAVNDYTVSLTLKKQSTAGKTLEGATFALEVSFDNGEGFSLVESKTTPESGVITFENLDRYAVYRVTETKAPTGYALLGDAVFVGRIAQEDITLTVGDSLILMMPTTGGNGMWLATLASALFAISAGWLISAGRKRKLSHR